MKRLAIIPARGGSKRLPRKNVLPLCGKPLITHTIEAVLRSGCFSKTIVSSDDDEILSLGREYPDVTVEQRDPALAGDKIKVIDLVKRIAARGEHDDFDQIALLLPTCPFRSAEDISNAADLLTANEFGVVSVCEMADPVQLSMTVDSETAVIDPEALLKPSPLVTGQTRSQDFRKYYRVNGGIYLAWLEQFRLADNFFQGRVKAHAMPQERSVDVDTELDLAIAELIGQRLSIAQGTPS